MKTTLMLLAIFMSFSIGLQAQNTSKKIKPHKVWITLMDGIKVKGDLYSADDVSIKIAKNNSLDVSNLTAISNQKIDVIKIRRKGKKNNSLDVSNLTAISNQKIDVIKIRRKGKIGKGAWIGAASGAGFGIILGLATEDDGWEGLVATAEGIFFGAVGTGVGAGIGAIKKRIQINGNIDIYKSRLSEIQSYSLVPNNATN